MGQVSVRMPFGMWPFVSHVQSWFSKLTDLLLASGKSVNHDIQTDGDQHVFADADHVC